VESREEEKLESQSDEKMSPETNSAEPHSDGRSATADQQPFDPETADREALLRHYRELEEKLQGAEEKVLRVAADAENFKKRLEREKQEYARYANEKFIRELLPVLDNLERALEHATAGANQEGLVQGLQMTIKAFTEALERFGCTVVEALGKSFDPNFHEAVCQEESTEHPANTVLRELQKGYMLNDRLLRPAMVAVARSPDKDSTTGEDKSTTDAERKSNNTVKVKVSQA